MLVPNPPEKVICLMKIEKCHLSMLLECVKNVIFLVKDFSVSKVSFFFEIENKHLSIFLHPKKLYFNMTLSLEFGLPLG